jgi:hypothetical protein
LDVGDEGVGRGVKGVTRAQAQRRLALYETEVMNPLLAMIRTRVAAEDDGFKDPSDVLLEDALDMVHDELRWMAMNDGPPDAQKRPSAA